VRELEGVAELPPGLGALDRGAAAHAELDEADDLEALLGGVRAVHEGVREEPDAVVRVGLLVVLVHDGEGLLPDHHAARRDQGDPVVRPGPHALLAQRQHALGLRRGLYGVAQLGSYGLRVADAGRLPLRSSIRSVNVVAHRGENLKDEDLRGSGSDGEE